MTYVCFGLSASYFLFLFFCLLFCFCLLCEGIISASDSVSMAICHVNSYLGDFSGVIRLVINVANP